MRKERNAATREAEALREEIGRLRAENNRIVLDRCKHPYEDEYGEHSCEPPECRMSAPAQPSADDVERAEKDSWRAREMVRKWGHLDAQAQPGTDYTDITSDEALDKYFRDIRATANHTDLARAVIRGMPYRWEDQVEHVAAALTAAHARGRAESFQDGHEGGFDVALDF
jgi:hypothetical protein